MMECDRENFTRTPFSVCLDRTLKGCLGWGRAEIPNVWNSLLRRISRTMSALWVCGVGCASLDAKFGQELTRGERQRIMGTFKSGRIELHLVNRWASWGAVQKLDSGEERCQKRIPNTCSGMCNVNYRLCLPDKISRKFHLWYEWISLWEHRGAETCIKIGLRQGWDCKYGPRTFDK